MHVGIYSGSFNPIHVGHVALCDYLVAQGVVDEVWLIRSPLNPLKAAQAETLAPDHHRQAMLMLAIEGHPGLRCCTIEDDLPRPNYSVQTLQALQRQHPDVTFHLIIGADNWLIFDRWRQYDVILRDFHLIVYPRPGYPLPPVDARQYPHVQVVDAPQHDLASTTLRQQIGQGIRPDDTQLNPRVLAYIINNSLYGISTL